MSTQKKSIYERYNVYNPFEECRHKKHPCTDCGFCQWCSDSRCDECLARKHAGGSDASATCPVAPEREVSSEPLETPEKESAGSSAKPVMEGENPSAGQPSDARPTSQRNGKKGPQADR